jgi:NADH-quinone oxidoreductase subunit D/NADH-quinone oxidoreductase subunit C/D
MELLRIDNVPEGFQSGLSSDETSEEYFLNMGPQHPSTHGVLRLVLKLNGESVLDVVPHLGYVHRGIEKMVESQTYLQNIHLTDRLDYLSSHINNLGYCMAMEQALDIGVPERGEYIRVMVSELQRIQSHLLWWGVAGMDLGAITTFLYGWKEREIITDIFEELCGARLTMNFFRPGGSFADVPDTFIPRIQKVIEIMKVALDEYNTRKGPGISAFSAKKKPFLTGAPVLCCGLRASVMTCAAMIRIRSMTVSILIFPSARLAAASTATG